MLQLVLALCIILRAIPRKAEWHRWAGVMSLGYLLSYSVSQERPELFFLLPVEIALLAGILLVLAFGGRNVGPSICAGLALASRIGQAVISQWARNQAQTSGLDPVVLIQEMVPYYSLVLMILEVSVDVMLLWLLLQLRSQQVNRI